MELLIDHFMVCHLFSLISVWKNWEGDISAPGSCIHVYVEPDMSQNGWPWRRLWVKILKKLSSEEVNEPLRNNVLILIICGILYSYRTSHAVLFSARNDYLQPEAIHTETLTNALCKSIMQSSTDQVELGLERVEQVQKGKDFFAN